MRKEIVHKGATPMQQIKDMGLQTNYKLQTILCLIKKQRSTKKKLQRD